MSEASPHFSFSHFYEESSSDNLPFCDGPDTSRYLSGSVVFLDVAVKRNTQAPANQAPTLPSKTIHLISKMMNKLEKNIQGGDKEVVPVQPSQSAPSSPERPVTTFVDYKKTLLPLILTAIGPLPETTTTSTFEVPEMVHSILRDDRLTKSLNEFPKKDPRIQDIQRLVDEIKQEQKKSRMQLLKTTAVLLPTDSQWYQLNQLRIHAGAPERSEQGIERLLNYYAQLIHMEKKFPFDTLQVDVSYTWYDAFTDKKVISHCIQHEKAAVIFNCGAIYSQLATCQSIQTQQGKKQAALYFQKAASMFQYCRDTLTQRLQVRLDKYSDLNEATLSALSDIMLAQAAECYFEKANEDKTSSQTTSVIAVQVAHHYENALQSASSATPLIWDKLPRTWMNHIKSKYLLFTAIAHYHMPSVMTADKVLAERIARLMLVKQFMMKALKTSSNTPISSMVQAYADMMNSALILAQAANFEKHHQTQVDPRLLAPLKRSSHALMEPSAESPVGDLKRFNDIFHAILSPTHHQDITNFFADCTKLVQAGQTELKHFIQDIDGKITHEEKSRIHQANLGKQAHYDLIGMKVQLHQKALALLKQLEMAQEEEDVLSSEELLGSLVQLHEHIIAHFNESAFIINKLEKEASSSSRWGQLRSAAARGMENMRERRLKLREATEMYENESEFSVLGWNKEQLLDVLPCLSDDYTRITEITEEDEQLKEMLLKEKDAIVRRMEEFKKRTALQLAEIEKMGHLAADFGACQESDINSALVQRREQLKLIEEAVQNARREKNQLVTCWEESRDNFSRRFLGKSEIENQARLMESFVDSLDQYEKFRRMVQSEVKACMTLKDQSQSVLGKCQKIESKWTELGSHDDRHAPLRPMNEPPFVTRLHSFTDRPSPFLPKEAPGYQGQDRLDHLQSLKMKLSKQATLQQFDSPQDVFKHYSRQLKLDQMNMKKQIQQVDHSIQDHEREILRETQEILKQRELVKQATQLEESGESLPAKIKSGLLKMVGGKFALNEDSRKSSFETCNEGELAEESLEDMMEQVRLNHAAKQEKQVDDNVRQLVSMLKSKEDRIRQLEKEKQHQIHRDLRQERKSKSKKLDSSSSEDASASEKVQTPSPLAAWVTEQNQRFTSKPPLRKPSGSKKRQDIQETIQAMAAAAAASTPVSPTRREQVSPRRKAVPMDHPHLNVFTVQVETATPTTLKAAVHQNHSNLKAEPKSLLCEKCEEPILKSDKMPMYERKDSGFSKGNSSDQVDVLHPTLPLNASHRMRDVLTQMKLENDVLIEKMMSASSSGHSN